MTFGSIQPIRSHVTTLLSFSLSASTISVIAEQYKREQHIIVFLMRHREWTGVLNQPYIQVRFRLRPISVPRLLESVDI